MSGLWNIYMNNTHIYNKHFLTLLDLGYFMKFTNKKKGLKMWAQINTCRYDYKLPFLESKGRVEIDDNRVGPLFEHTFSPSLSPSLSFVGIPRKVQ